MNRRGPGGLGQREQAAYNGAGGTIYNMGNPTTDATVNGITAWGDAGTVSNSRLSRRPARFGFSALAPSAAVAAVEAGRLDAQL